MDLDFFLIQKMKLGDDIAIETFVNKYYMKIFQYCYLHIKDNGNAKDLTQETFEKFFRSLGQYQHYGKALNYLYVIAANKCKDYYKKKQELFIEDMPEQKIMDTDKIDNKIAVEMAIDRLPKELKEVVILYFFQQLRQKEIARILDIGLPLTKYRIRKSKEFLASYLGKEEEFL